MEEKVKVVYVGTLSQLILSESGLTVTRNEPFECDKRVFEELKSGPNGEEFKVSGSKPEKK